MQRLRPVAAGLELTAQDRTECRDTAPGKARIAVPCPWGRARAKAWIKVLCGTRVASVGSPALRPTRP